LSLHVSTEMTDTIVYSILELIRLMETVNKFLTTASRLCRLVVATVQHASEAVFDTMLAESVEILTTGSITHQHLQYVAFRV
jgi:hypothetical protein